MRPTQQPDESCDASTRKCWRSKSSRSSWGSSYTTVATPMSCAPQASTSCFAPRAGPIVAVCLSAESPDHPCSTLALSQWVGRSVEERRAYWPRFHQLPEPWVGRLATAPILFVASNPGLGGSIPADPATTERKPHFVTDEWADEKIIHRYDPTLPTPRTSEVELCRVSAIGRQSPHLWQELWSFGAASAPNLHDVPGERTSAAPGRVTVGSTRHDGHVILGITVEPWASGMSDTLGWHSQGESANDLRRVRD